MNVSNLSVKVSVAWWALPSLLVLRAMAPVIVRIPGHPAFIASAIAFVARHGVKVAA